MKEILTLSTHFRVESYTRPLLIMDVFVSTGKLANRPTVTNKTPGIIDFLEIKNFSPVKI